MIKVGDKIGSDYGDHLDVVTRIEKGKAAVGVSKIGPYYDLRDLVLCADDVWRLRGARGLDR